MKKPKKIKTYVLTVSKKFIGSHPRKGHDTEFKEKIENGKKKHTIRKNYDFWKKRIDGINEGEAILSIRQWTGKPYNSKQIEIKKLYSGEVGIQKIITGGGASDIAIVDFNQDDNKNIYRFLDDSVIKKISKNDGLRMADFKSWFKEPLIDGCIIHFTKLKY